MITVLIADDHPVFRHGMRGMLEAADDMEVVGEATTGTEAVASALQLAPDVVLMDLKMPGLNGVEALLDRPEVGGRRTSCTCCHSSPGPISL